MPICNPLTNRTISEINEDLNRLEKEFYKRDDTKKYTNRDYWEVLEAGIKKIENCPTKHLMFSKLDD